MFAHSQNAGTCQHFLHLVDLWLMQFRLSHFQEIHLHIAQLKIKNHKI
jgi:hypothetical protein